jgi:hypothetical protein
MNKEDFKEQYRIKRIGIRKEIDESPFSYTGSAAYAALECIECRENARTRNVLLNGSELSPSLRLHLQHRFF